MAHISKFHALPTNQSPSPGLYLRFRCRQVGLSFRPVALAQDRRRLRSNKGPEEALQGFFVQ
jgi:hypothetical protein